MRTTIIPPTSGHPPVDTHTDPEDWRHRAACRDEDPELFFPVGGDGPTPSAAVATQIREAKAVCRRCPVRQACLSWALANVDHGVFGAKTPDERRALKRRTRRGATS